MTGTAGAGELGSSCGPETSVVGESGVGGTGNAGIAEGGEAEVKSGVGCSGGEGDRGESVSDELESSLLSLRSSSSHCLFLAILVGGSAVGDGVRTGGSGTVG
jgi:hypothetical protein